jgi:hypothetical protein
MESGSKSTAPEEMSNETKATSASGATKMLKLARFSLIPWDALEALAEHYGRGAVKYGERNWEKGYPWSWSYDALQRHAHAWLSGQDRDPQTKAHHMVCVAWHAFALIAFASRGIGEDDRRKQATRVMDSATKGDEWFSAWKMRIADEATRSSGFMFVWDEDHHGGSERSAFAASRAGVMVRMSIPILGGLREARVFHREALDGESWAAWLARLKR